VVRVLFPSKDFKSIFIDEEDKKNLPTPPPKKGRKLTASYSTPSVYSRSPDPHDLSIRELRDYLRNHERNQKRGIISIWQIPGVDSEDTCPLDPPPLPKQNPLLARSSTTPSMLACPLQPHGMLQPMNRKYPMRPPPPLPEETNHDFCYDFDDWRPSESRTKKKALQGSLSSSHVKDLSSSPSTSKEESKASSITLPPIVTKNKSSVIKTKRGDSGSSTSLPSLVNSETNQETTTKNSTSGATSSVSILRETPKSKQEVKRGAEALNKDLGDNEQKPKLNVGLEDLDTKALMLPSGDSSPVKHATMQSRSQDSTTSSSSKSTSPSVVTSSCTSSSSSIDAKNKKSRASASPLTTKTSALPP